MKKMVKLRAAATRCLGGITNPVPQNTHVKYCDNPIDTLR
jgi:hypothetical protein